MNLLCFGYGQVAKNLVSNLLKKKVNLNLTISTRENSSIKKLGDFEFENLQFKENAYDNKILDKLNEYDYILISVPPINSNDLFLKNLITEHHYETESLLSKKIIDNFDQEIENFIQVCPKEMIDKLENPISNKVVSFAS